MDILLLIIAQYILGYAFQGTIYILGLYAFNRKKIQLQKFIISSIIFMIVIYIARSLPISFGVHTLIILLVLVAISIKYLKLQIYATIRAALIMTIVTLLSETINVFALGKIFSETELQSILANPLHKALAVIPSNCLFAIVVFACYILLNRPKNKVAD